MSRMRLACWKPLAILPLVLFLTTPALQSATDAAKQYFVYFGTYTRTKGKGIYAYRFEPATGKLTSLGLMAETPHPSFIAAHPNGRFLYAANEHEGDDPPGKNNTVSAYAIDPATGKLTFLNKVSSEGEGPCHVSVDKTGKTLLVANFRSGSVAALPIQQNGRLRRAASIDQHKGSSIDPVRQKGPHAHFIAPSPDNRFALSVDLGLDQIILYKLDAVNSKLTPNNPPVMRVPPGTQPRHLTFHPSGKFAYVNSEKASTVTAFDYDDKEGSLREFQTLSTRPISATGANTTAEIQVDPSGQFLYATNRGLDTIALFSIEQATGSLSYVESVPTEGKTPRYFAFDPSNEYVFAGNQDSGTVIVYKRDTNTGRLTKTEVLTDIPEPACILFVSAKE